MKVGAIAGPLFLWAARANVTLSCAIPVGFPDPGFHFPENVGEPQLSHVSNSGSTPVAGGLLLAHPLSTTRPAYENLTVVFLLSKEYGFVFISPRVTCYMHGANFSMKEVKK